MKPTKKINRFRLVAQHKKTGKQIKFEIKGFLNERVDCESVIFAHMQSYVPSSRLRALQEILN
jgi:hypothetical protein